MGGNQQKELDCRSAETKGEGPPDVPDWLLDRLTEAEKLRVEEAKLRHTELYLASLDAESDVPVVAATECTTNTKQAQEFIRPRGHGVRHCRRDRRLS